MPRHPQGYTGSGTRPLMNAFLRLLRYAAPHRAVITGAVLAMVVYGAASAALAWIIKFVIDDVLPRQRQLGFVTAAILITYFLKGLGSYFSSYLMEGLGHRVVMVVRNQLFRHLLDQSAAFFARRTSGQLLSRINNDVGLVQRAVVGDGGRPRARVARARRVGGLAVLLRRQARDGVHDGGAADRLSAGAPRQARAHRDALEPGGAGEHVARGGRGLHRPSHRQGLRRRGARGGEVREGVASALPDQPEGHARPLGAAAA